MEMKTFTGIVYADKELIRPNAIVEIWTHEDEVESEGWSEYVLIKAINTLQTHCINENVFHLLVATGMDVTDFVLSE